MKKIIFLAMAAVALIIFNGCQKENLNVDHLVDEVQLQFVVKPDVYVENGYLAFKNLQAVDSLVRLLNTMTTDERINWENQLNFKSAKTHYAPIFEESERISSIEDMIAFKEKYRD